MPLPLFLGIAAAAAGAAGLGAGIHGAVKMKEANDTMDAAKYRHEKNVRRFEETNKKTTQGMDALGKMELEILKEFEAFSDVIEKIQMRPEFHAYNKGSVQIPKYNKEELKNVSVGAGVLLGGVGGAAAGTAGGFAAAGATTAAVMALGTASTGTAIASLSGAAATNATLAALGGGAVWAGGGGIALGTTVLGAATLGVGLLVGGVIFNLTGSSLSEKADEAWAQANRAEKEVDRICVYLDQLYETEERYRETLTKVNLVYKNHFQQLNRLVSVEKKTNWLEYSVEEQLLTENTVLLVGLLYNMCKVQLVLQSKDESELNKVNSAAVDNSIQSAKDFLRERSLGTVA